MYVSGGNQLIDSKKTLAKIGLIPGMHIADLGCGGAGHFIVPAGQIVGEGGKAYAVDILRSVLEVVSKRARMMGIHTIKSVWANLEIIGSTKIPENSLDRALIINLLFQSKEHKNIFQEAYRIMKPGAMLLVIDWNEAVKTFGPPMVDRAKPVQVKSLAQGVGFKFIEAYSPGPYHFGMVFEK